MRIAILDDYQDVARTLADWRRLDGRATVTVFNAPFGDADAAAAALAPFNALVCMR